MTTDLFLCIKKHIDISNEKIIGIFVKKTKFTEVHNFASLPNI